MAQIVLKDLPLSLADAEISFRRIWDYNSINNDILQETIEFLEDYLYIWKREKQANIEYVWEEDVMDLISKYK